jgi:hypothetical protein
MNLKAIKIIGWVTLVIGVITIPIPYDYDLMMSTGSEYAVISLISSIVWIGVGVTLILAVRRKEKRNNLYRSEL